MPKIRIDDTDGFLSSALRAYQGELIEVSSAVQTQARVAALDPDRYVPSDIAREIELITRGFRCLDAFQGNAANQVFGIDIAVDVLEVMGSALEHQREA